MYSPWVWQDEGVTWDKVSTFPRNPYHPPRYWPGLYHPWDYAGKLQEIERGGIEGWNRPVMRIEYEMVLRQDIRFSSIYVAKKV